MNDYRDNIEIDLKDLGKQVLKKWRILLVFMVIGAVIGAVYGFVGNKPEPEPEVKLSKLEEALSDKEILEVRNAVDVYLNYKKIYDEVKAYQNNTAIMSIDTNLAPTARKMYLISDYEESDTYTDGPSVIDNIIALYMSMIYEDDVAGAVSASVDSVINKEYAKELYSMGKSGMSMIVLSVNATNKQDAMLILDTLAEKIMEKSFDVKSYIPHNIQEVSTTYEAMYDDDIRNRKMNLINGVKSLNDAMIAVPSSLSSNQKSYYNALVEQNNIDYGIVREEYVEEISLISIVKYAIAGALGLAFLYMMIIALRYVMTPVLKTEDDIRNVFGLPVIGCVKAIDNADISLLSSSIEAIAKAEKCDQISFIGANEGSDVEEKKSQLLELFGDKDVSVIVVGNILKDPHSIEKVTSSKAVVLFEKIGASRYEDIAREIELCKNYGVNILGTVVLQ